MTKTLLPVIRRGDKGDDVKRLQMLLIAHGFNLGPAPGLGIDGDFGPKTLAAYNSFLRGEDRVLTETVTQPEWDLLFEATNPGEPPWAVVARGEIGQREVRGTNDNPRIMAYYVAAGFPPDATNFEDHDEIAWCEAFRRFCYVTAGISLAGVPKSLMARDSLKHGEPVTGRPQAWDHAAWPRGTGYQGHTAFILREDGDYYVALAGNQGFDGGPSDAVSVSAIRKAGCLGIRRVRPATAKAPPVDRVPPPSPAIKPEPKQQRGLWAWLRRLFGF